MFLCKTVFFKNVIAASVCFFLFSFFLPFFFFFFRVIDSLSLPLSVFSSCANAFLCSAALELVQTQATTTDMGAAGVILLILFIVVAIVGILAFLGWFARRQ